MRPVRHKHLLQGAKPDTVNQLAGRQNRCYPARNRLPSTRLKDYYTMISEILEEPLTFKEAYSNLDWKEAILREADLLKQNQTWTVVDRP
jgi:hypothetical protein